MHFYSGLNCYFKKQNNVFNLLNTFRQRSLNVFWAAVANLNPLTPNSDENEISLYIITTCSNILVMRIKEVITKDKMSWYLDKFSLLVP